VGGPAGEEEERSYTEKKRDMEEFKKRKKELNRMVKSA